MRSPKIYEQRAVIEVAQETPRVINIQEINREDFKLPDVLETIKQTAMSQTLLFRVVKANGLDKDPHALRRKKMTQPIRTVSLLHGSSRELTSNYAAQHV
jgi:hypothetical protein